MAYKRVSGWRLGWSLSILNFVKYHPPPENILPWPLIQLGLPDCSIRIWNACDQFQKKIQKIARHILAGSTVCPKPTPLPPQPRTRWGSVGKRRVFEGIHTPEGGGWKIFAFNLPQVGNVFCFYGQGEYREMILTVILPWLSGTVSCAPEGEWICLLCTDLYNVTNEFDKHFLGSIIETIYWVITLTTAAQVIVLYSTVLQHSCFSGSQSQGRIQDFSQEGVHL